MARYVVKLPDLGEGMTEGEIVAWHVAPGQAIREEDPLVDVMTDKATIELPSPVAGTVVAVNGKPGERRPVGSELVVLEVAGADNLAETTLSASASRSASPQPLTPALSPPAGRGGDARPTSNVLSPRSRGEGQGEGQSQQSTAGAPPPLAGEGREGAIGKRPGEKPLASPAVRRRAWDAGVVLQFVPGTGPGGRVTQADLDAYLDGAGKPAGAAARPVSRRPDDVEAVPITGLRRAIAEHMQRAKQHIPHFSYVEEVDVTALEELRAELNAGYPHPDPAPRAGEGIAENPPPRAGEGIAENSSPLAGAASVGAHLTLLPFLMRAVVAGVAAHPQVNARYDDAAGVLHRHKAVHIGLATQTDGGLLVPVVRHAEALDLWQAAAELRRLTEAARAGTAARAELTGSTITITSLGRLGGIAATPIINYPEVAIVGVNRIVERPVVRDGSVVIRKIMNLSSSFDHRIVDGWEAAAFIQRIKHLLEQPALLFIG